MIGHSKPKAYRSNNVIPNGRSVFSRTQGFNLITLLADSNLK